MPWSGCGMAPGVSVIKGIRGLKRLRNCQGGDTETAWSPTRKHTQRSVSRRRDQLPGGQEREGTEPEVDPATAGHRW